MDAIRVAIVDDNKMEMERAVSAVTQLIDENQYKVSIKQYTNGKQLIADLEDEILYDVYLLDIDLPDYPGFDLAERIHRMNPAAYVVFNTSHDNLGKKTFPFFPYATIFKSEGEKPIRMIIDRICKEIVESEDGVYMIHNERRFVRFPMREIVYIEKEGKNTVFHCKGDITYEERRPLKEVYSVLPEDQFAYIDKGVVINLLHIKKVLAHELMTTEDELLSISRQMRPKLNDKLMEYFERRA